MPASNTIAIHPLPENLQNLKSCIEACHPENTVHAFRDPLLAMQYAFNNPVDSVYTVVGMNRMNGFEVARMMRKIQPLASINFVDRSDSYRKDAQRLAVRTYLVEPVTVEQMRAAEAEADALDREFEDILGEGSDEQFEEQIAVDDKRKTYNVRNL